VVTGFSRLGLQSDYDLLLHEGRQVICVARQLGHDARLTLTTYGHVIDVPARIDAPVQVVTAANVERARSRFPLPVEPFNDPLIALLGA
jgi:hypothetical protein